MKYSVTIQFIGSTTFEVEAESEDDAINAALERAPQNDFAFAEYDAGEWYVDDDKRWPSVHLLEPDPAVVVGVESAEEKR